MHTEGVGLGGFEQLILEPKILDPPIVDLGGASDRSSWNVCWGEFLVGIGFGVCV